MVRLLASGRFAPLFWTQFLSAFADNLLKTALVFLILATVAGDAGPALVTLAGAVFIAPFFFLSALGGELADASDRGRLIRRLKLAELGAAAVAAAGFLLSSVPLLFAALALFGIVSALFGPVKYAILPDLLAPSDLAAGNALVEGATFIAILAGAAAAGIAAEQGPHPVVQAGLVAVVSLLTLGASLFVPSTRPADAAVRPQANIAASTVRLVASLYGDRRLWPLAIAGGWFWTVGAVMLQLMPSFVTAGLGAGEIAATACLAVFAVGIAAGSAVAAFLCGDRIVLLPVTIGAGLIAVFAGDLAFVAASAVPADGEGIAAFLARPGSVRLLVDLAGMAVAGGLVVVPSFAALQAGAPAESRARSVAAASVVAAGMMTAGSALVAAAQAAGATLPALFAALALLSAAAAAVFARRLPGSALADAAWMMLRILFRIEARGLDNLRSAGSPAVVVSNHVSLLDAVVLLALDEEIPVFAIDRGMAAKAWVRPFLRATRAFPLDPGHPLATRSLVGIVRGGDRLAIFPEGRITVTGALMKIYAGAAMVADKSDAPVVPVHIRGLEATPFSRMPAGTVRRRWFPRVSVLVGQPTRLAVDPALAGRARRTAAADALRDVMAGMAFRMFDTGRTVPQAVAEAARREGFGRLALEDPTSGRISYWRMLAGAAALGRALSAHTREGAAVAVMLPNASASAMTVIGLMSAGRVPAMINVTAGAAAVRSACRTSEAEVLVTSRRFVEAARLQPLVAALGGVTVLYLEDLAGRIGIAARLASLARSGRPLVRRSPDDPAVILFTSGSEGEPKAVVLSHRNLLANAAQASAVLDFGRADKVFGVLPLFHAFGLTAGLVLPLACGVPVFLYPSPLHMRIVPEMVYASNATILFGTDTFLSGWARAAHDYDFRSVRLVVAGAEPVREATRRTYMERFGLRILEGYGVTEAAPVLALATPLSSRAGTVGKLLPGIAARLEPMPGVDAGGRLHVRGPNIMLGLMRAEEPGLLVPPPDGWHDTGDIVDIAADGHVTIRGRAKRFAKIAGEMVSLAAVEQLAAEFWPGRLSAVAAMPDPRKGERLVLLTEDPDATRAAFHRFATGRGLADIAVPAEVRSVSRLPVLGSGKIDHVAVGRMARDAGALPGAAAMPQPEPVSGSSAAARPAAGRTG